MVDSVFHVGSLVRSRSFNVNVLLKPSYLRLYFRYIHILPQDESSPHNMKLTDHHMFTPFPP